MGRRSPFPPKDSAILVGWVERQETQHSVRATLMVALLSSGSIQCLPQKHRPARTTARKPPTLRAERNTSNAIRMPSEPDYVHPPWLHDIGCGKTRIVFSSCVTSFPDSCARPKIHLIHRSSHFWKHTGIRGVRIYRIRPYTDGTFQSPSQSGDLRVFAWSSHHISFSYQKGSKINEHKGI